MTHDDLPDDLPDRVRERIGADPQLTEQRMFGGLAFLIGGNMAVAASGRGGLMVRADRDEADALIESGPAEPVVMRDRPVRGWLHIAAEHLRTDEQLARWVDLGVARARSLPPK